MAYHATDLEDGGADAAEVRAPEQPLQTASPPTPAAPLARRSTRKRKLEEMVRHPIFMQEVIKCRV